MIPAAPSPPPAPGLKPPPRPAAAVVPAQPWDAYGFTRASLASLPAHEHRGLLNQGATCYLNSVLQTLHYTPEMRRCILAWRRAGEQESAAASPASPVCIESRSIVVQLQRLLLRLLYSRSGVASTGALTTSFGWRSDSIWTQHDAQEFIQKLYERMQTEDECLRAEVQRLNHGTQVDFVQCATCGTRRAKEQPFLTLPIECKGLKSIEESLRAYCTPERLEGSNAYRCSVCNSKQPATKGVALQHCPKLMTLQLKRFDMDWNSGQRIKISTPVRFADRLQMKEFITPEQSHTGDTVPASAATPALAASSSKPPSTEYELFSILMHTGSANGGHYYSYTKDLWQRRQQDLGLASRDDPCWFECNDTAVTRLTHEEVAEMFADPYAAKPASNSSGGASAPVAPSLSRTPPAAPAPPSAPAPPPIAPPVIPAAPPAAPAPPPAPAAPFAPPASSPSPPLPPPGPPGAPSAPALSFAAPTRAATAQSGATSMFLSDFASTVPEAPGLDAPIGGAGGRGGSSGPTSNAYMLVYRRVDSEGEEQDQLRAIDWRSIVSPLLLAELDEENAAFDAYAAHIALEDSFVTLTVHYPLQPSDSENAPTTVSGVSSSSAPPASISTMSVTLKLPFAATINELVDASLERLQSEKTNHCDLSGAKPESHRIRQFESKAIPARIGEYVLDASNAKTLRELMLRNGQELFLQPALPGSGEFPAVCVPSIRLKLVRFDSEAMGLANAGAPHVVQVPFDISVQALKELLASDASFFPRASASSACSVGAIDPARVNFVLCPKLKDEATIVEISKQSSAATPIERSMQGNLEQAIYVELYPMREKNEGAEQAFEPTSLLVPWLQLQGHLLTISFNKLPPLIPEAAAALSAAEVPSSSVPARVGPAVAPLVHVTPLDQHLEIDDRLPLLELKKRIAAHLSDDPSCPLDLSSFRLLREEHSIELKDLSRSLSMNHLRDLGSVFVERGRPMDAGEFIFRVFLHDPSKVPAPGSAEWNAAIIIDAETNEPTNSPEELAFVSLGDARLRETMTYAEVTATLAALPGAPAPSLIRLRDRLENSLTGIWYSDRTLKQNCPGAFDLYPLVIQPLRAPELFTSHDLLLSLRHWIPGRLELKPSREVVWPKTMKVTQVKERIAEMIMKEIEEMQMQTQQTQQTHKADDAGEAAPASAAAAVPPAASPSAPALLLTASDVEVVIAAPHELRDLGLLPGLPWGAKLSESASLSSSPWRLRHGDTILYKLRAADKLGSAIDRADVASRALLFNLQYGGGSSAAGGHVRSTRGGGGPELHILTEAEIIAREEREIAEAWAEIQRKEKEAADLQATLQAIANK